MPIDPSIILGVKPIQIADPLEQYGKALTVRNLMQTSDMQSQKIADDQATRQAYIDSAGDQSKILPNLMSGGQYGAAQTFQKNQLENAQTQSVIGKNNAETLVKATAAHRDQLANVNDRQTAAQWVAAGYNDPTLKPIFSQSGSLEDAISRIPTDPQKFNEWKRENALGAAKFIELNKPNVVHVNTGAQTQLISTPGLGGAPTVVGSLQNTQSPDSVASTATARRGQNLVDARQREANGIAAGGLTENAESMAQAIASGQLAPLSGFALSKPSGQGIMSRVMQINPDYNGQDFGVGTKATKDFATGKQGNAVRSFNVGISHLDTLSGLGDALNNGDTQLLNRIGNAYSTQTGNPAPVNFETAKQIVGDEVTKAIVGGGGGVADREKAQKVLDAVQSPAQLKGAIGTLQTLMRGQLDGLQQQYEQSTGRKDFNRFLSPAAQNLRHGSAPATTFNAMPDPASLNGRSISSDDGTIYKSNGKQWVKQ